MLKARLHAVEKRSLFHITGFPSVTASAAKHYNQHHPLHHGSVSQPNGVSCVSLLLAGRSFTPSSVDSLRLMFSCRDPGEFVTYHLHRVDVQGA